MTLDEVLDAVRKYGNTFVKVTLTQGRQAKGILQNAFGGHPKDPRGYTKDYFFILRVDKSPNAIEKYDCEEALTIEAN